MRHAVCFFVSGASSVVLGAVIIGKISRKVILVADGVGMLAFFLLVFFSRSQLPIFLGIMGMGIVVGVTALLLIAIVISVWSDRND